MLRLKDYRVTKNVHVYKQGDLLIAYDVNSGSLHTIDQITYDMIKGIEKIQCQNPDHDINSEDLYNFLLQIGVTILKKEIEDIFSEFADLQQEGTLFAAEAEQIPPKFPEKPVIKAMCLHVAHDCNLRCEYCFAGTGAFGGSRTLMDLETGKKGIDFILEASGHRSHCEVDFFGGEPLLNMKVVKELVHYGKEKAAAKGKSIKYTLTTNAVLLNKEVQDFLEKEDISVVISLDGRPETHDRMRPYANQQGSYKDVVPKIKDFVAKRTETSPYALGTYYYVRGTYTHFNLDFDQDVLHMADLDIKNISLEPVVARPEDPYAFQKEDIAKIFAAYDRLAEEMLERRKEDKDFSFFHFNVAVDQGPCLPKRLSGCGAGHEYVAISPEGDIYPCHQFVGQEKYKMGSLHGENAGTLALNLIKDFRSAHIYNKPQCEECWARFACSGGCHAANAAFSGKLKEVYTLGCELQKKRLEVALYLKVKEAMNGMPERESVPESIC